MSGERLEGHSLEDVRSRLTQGLDGVGAGVNPRLAALERELREHGLTDAHEDLFARLHEAREERKRASGDMRAELDEPDYSTFLLLHRALVERDAERQRAKAEKGAGARLKVNEMPEDGGDEPVDARPSAQWPAYQAPTGGAGADVSAVLVGADAGGAGTCAGCGMWLPSHMDEHHDLFTGKTVTLCPMCNCCNHLEWAGLQKAGKVIWCPWLPQGFMSRLTILTVLAAPYYSMWNWVQERVDAGGWVEAETGLPVDEAGEMTLLGRLRAQPEMQNLDEGRFKEDIRIFREWHRVLGYYTEDEHLSASVPMPASPGKLAVRITGMYDWLGDAVAPLEELLGTADGSRGGGDALDVTDPLFWAEQMRAEGFTRHEVGRVLAGLRKDGGPLGDAGLRASSMGAVFSRLAGLRFLPDAGWWAALVEGPWKEHLQSRYGPATWGALLKGMEAGEGQKND